MVICISGPCWHLLEQLCSHQSLWSQTPSPLYQLKVPSRTWFWPSVLMGHLAFSLFCFARLLLVCQPSQLLNVHPLSDIQEASICSPVPPRNYGELRVTALGPCCLETTYSSFSSHAALLNFCFSDFISTIKVYILLFSDPQLVRGFQHFPLLWTFGLDREAKHHLRDPLLLLTLLLDSLFLLSFPGLGIIVGKADSYIIIHSPASTILVWPLHLDSLGFWVLKFKEPSGYH